MIFSGHEGALLRADVDQAGRYGGGTATKGDDMTPKASTPRTITLDARVMKCIGAYLLLAAAESETLDWDFGLNKVTPASARDEIVKLRGWAALPRSRRPALQGPRKLDGGPCHALARAQDTGGGGDKMKIKMRSQPTELVEEDVEFPIYRLDDHSEWPHTLVYYTRIDTDCKMYTITVKDGGFELLVGGELRNDFGQGGRRDYVLGLGLYKSSKEEFNGVMKRARVFLDTFELRG